MYFGEIWDLAKKNTQSKTHLFYFVLQLPCTLDLTESTSFFNPLLYQLSYRA